MTSSPTKNPNTLQLTTWTQLIKDNPKSEVWQKHIKDIKNNYPDLLGDVNPYSNEQKDKLGPINYDAFLARDEIHLSAAKAGFIKAPEACTTGLSITPAIVFFIFLIIFHFLLHFFSLFYIFSHYFSLFLIIFYFFLIIFHFFSLFSL